MTTPVRSIETSIGTLHVSGHEPDNLSVHGEGLTVNRIPLKVTMSVAPGPNGWRLVSGYGIRRTDTLDFSGDSLSWNLRGKVTEAVLAAATEAASDPTFVKETSIAAKRRQLERLRAEAVELERKAAENLSKRNAISLELEGISL